MTVNPVRFGTRFLPGTTHSLFQKQAQPEVLNAARKPSERYPDYVLPSALHFQALFAPKCFVKNRLIPR